MTTRTLTSYEEFLLDLLRVSIATNDPKLATQTKAVLEIASKNKECDRTSVWEHLTPAEKTKFKELLTAGVA